jgi:hypothetical protein
MLASGAGKNGRHNRIKEDESECAYRVKRSACEVFAGNPEGKRSLLRPRHRWEENIKMDLKGIGLGDMGWIHLA